MYRKFFKRFLDIIFSLLALPLLIILFIIFSPIIYFEDKGTIFYKSDRLGRNGKVFKMYKFRSMKMNAPDLRNPDGSTYNGEDDPRVTKIGKFMRKTSLDEFPQIINVLKGDMSFIGPRPNTLMALKETDELMWYKMKVRPGITGYSQAYFRNEIRGREKYINDVYYVDNLSFFLDCKVLIKTIITVIKREKVYVRLGDNEKRTDI